ncbi:MAG: T9SS type A sorting domain-containing protein [Dyadobacter sp.]|uniref:T9SS type A sorting domain-containing protein n=1 Tax=Dyadobacter sp. TaxID=1914288 RepID=UPI003262DD76
MKQILLICLGLVFQTSIILAQPKGEKLVFPSPQAAQLSKFGGHNINHSTGTPNISIPIYTATEGSIQIPVSLSYHYTGFKADDMPAWCGRGWSLAATGQITRVVKGRRDELNNVGYLAKAMAIKNMVDDLSPDFAKFKALNVVENLNDNYPDQFSFEFMGYSGKFVFDENGIPQVLSDQRIKITPFIGTETVYNDLQSIIKWIITTEDGTKYTFQNYELSAGIDSGNTWDTTAWYLSEIVSAKGDRVTLEYSSISTVKKRLQLGRTEKMGFYDVGAGEGSTHTFNFNTNTSHEIYLQKIKGSLWEINFNSAEFTKTLSNNQVSTIRKLNTIQVVSTLPNPIQVKQFTFAYDANMQLLTFGEDGLPPYEMFYNGVIPPGIDGYTTQVDYFGYYNGQDNPSLIPGIAVVDLEPRTALTKIGALEKLVYPTKGYTTIDYQQNEYSYSQDVVISKAKTVVEDYNYYWNRTAAGPDGITKGPNPVLILTAPTRVDMKVYALPGSNVNCTDLNDDGWISVTLNAGTYTGENLFAANAYSPCNLTMGDVGFQLSLYVKAFKKTTANTVSYGGVRVASMKDYPAVDGTPITRSFTYKDAANASLSSGVIAQESVYELDVSVAVGGINMVYSSAPFNPVSLIPLYYKDVKETTSDFVKDYSFTSHQDRVDKKGKWAFNTYKDISNGSGTMLFDNTPYQEMGNLQSYDFMRTFPKKIVTKDLNGNIKQDITYLYDGYSFERIKVAALHHEFVTSYTLPIVDDPGQITYGLYYTKGLYIIGGWPRKISETVVDYGLNGAGPVSTTTTYEYGNTDHLQLTKKRVTQSNGTIEEGNFKYPLDFKNTPGKAAFIQSMITANMVSYPLEQTTILEKSAADRKVIDATVTTYKSVPGNANVASLLMPYKKFKFKGLNGSIGAFAAYGGTTDETASASYREAVKYSNYDTQGNPLSLLLNNGDNLSYLWAYKGQHPVAEIPNADNAAVATALSGTSFQQMADMTDPSTIKTKLDAVRNALPGSLTTSYIYAPLVGFNRIIDPAGKNLVYEYDALERLKAIKDNFGNTRSSYCYNYAGQVIDCELISATGSVVPPALFLISEEGALPVTLVTFNAVKEGNTALLMWNTTEETNSERFDIEHSTNGKAWVRIGSIEAQGESTGMVYYSFRDGSPAPGENLYRLKMVDRDGSYAHSKIKVLIFDDETLLFPNPILAGQQLHLESSELQKISHLKVYDVRGKLVHKFEKPGLQIDLGHLSAGAYIIQLTGTNGSVTTHRIIKQ